MSGVDGALRQLGPTDAQDVHDLTGGFGLTPTRLREELAAAEDFRWVGLTDPSGRLYAVHRSMRWGPYLFLKGVFVREDMRGSGAAMQLAFALRDVARTEGVTGIAAWYEPGMPESGIAELLRMRQQRPLIHRFALELSSDDVAADEAPMSLPTTDRPRFRGDVLLPRDAASDRSAAVDLFGEDDEEPMKIHWVLDGRRLVASASFGADRSGLAALVGVLGPIARANGADTLEIPVRAADIVGVLQLMHAKGRRRNRVPICLGALRFAELPARSAQW